MIANSLKSRLLLILLLATVSIQLLSFGGVGLLRGLEARALRSNLIADDITAVRTQLRTLTASARHALVPDLRRGHYGFRFVAAQQALPDSTNADVRLVLKHLEKQPRDALLAGAAVRDGTAHALRLPFDEHEHLLVTFDRQMASNRPSWTGVALYVLAVTALVVWVASIAVRLATKPLEDFTVAAHRLTQDVDTPPLAIDGPLEMQNAARAFNAMHQEIRRQLHERSQILAAISHDLKTPLTRLKLRLASFDATDQRLLMEADVDAMAGLIQEGLDYARSQQVREARVPVDLNHLIQSIVDQATDLGQDCDMQGHCSRPYPAAPRALERMLQNLVDNGLRYGTRVHIKLIEHRDAVEMQVHDNGPGIPAELREQVFEPYFRAESSRNRETGGTGLGLAIARNLVQAHGGRIWLEPGTNGGLLARVRLPF